MRLRGKITQVRGDQAEFTAENVIFLFSISEKWIGAQPPREGMFVFSALTQEGSVIHVFPVTMLQNFLRGVEIKTEKFLHWVFPPSGRTPISSLDVEV